MEFALEKETLCCLPPMPWIMLVLQSDKEEDRGKGLQ